MGTGVHPATAQVVFGCQEVSTAGIVSRSPVGSNQTTSFTLVLFLTCLKIRQDQGERDGMKFRTLEVTWKYQNHKIIKC